MTGGKIRYILVRYVDKDENNNVFAKINSNDYLEHLEALLNECDRGKTEQV